MRLSEILSCTIICCYAASYGSASPVTFNYEAEIVTIAGSPFGMNSDDDRLSRVSGFFTYETETPDLNPDSAERGEYAHDPDFGGLGGGAFAANVSPVSVDAFRVTGSATPFVGIEYFTSSNTFRFVDGPRIVGREGGTMSVNGIPDMNVELHLAITDSSATVFSGDSLPDPFPFQIPATTYPHTFALEDENGTALLQFLMLTGEAPPTDFDLDGDVDIDDLNLLLADGPIASGVAVIANENDQFDLNGDAAIDYADVSQWLAEAAVVNGLSSPYLPGDANLDGTVDGLDFDRWSRAKFTSSFAWDDGDFNGDGAVDVSDFNRWNENKFASSVSAATVPEPSCLPLMASGVFAIFARRRRSFSPRTPSCRKNGEVPRFSSGLRG